MVELLQAVVLLHLIDLSVPVHIPVLSCPPEFPLVKILDIGKLPEDASEEPDGGAIGDGVRDSNPGTPCVQKGEVFGYGHIPKARQGFVVSEHPERGDIAPALYRVHCVEPDTGVDHQALKLHLVLDIDPVLDGMGPLHTDDRVARTAGKADRKSAGLTGALLVVVEAVAGDLKPGFDKVSLGDLAAQIGFDAHPLVIHILKGVDIPRQEVPLAVAPDAFGHRRHIAGIGQGLLPVETHLIKGRRR